MKIAEPIKQAKRTGSMTKRMCFLLSGLIAAAAFAPAQGSAQGSLCYAMPGVWLWFDNSNVSFYPNGFARGGDTAHWRCSGRQVVIHWSRGWTDRLVLSPYGNYLSGFNQAGTPIWGQRKAGPGAL
jgi:hypothetical protein